ncbi:MAG: hypothetical protein ACREKH_14565 [Candidatus Rokuibacteriota bacterium]
MRSGAFLLAAVTLGSGGCEKSCQNTCQRVFDATECAVIIPGQNEEDLEQECTAECEEALQHAGPMGVYDPYIGDRPDQPDELENERQAAAWMECVWAVECPDLVVPGNSCHPIGI